MAMTVVPAVVLVLLEHGLRLFGVGHPSGFLVRIEDHDGYVTNERFGWRFFPPSLARRPRPMSLAAPKPAGTCRIFVLGGSAAQGVPDPTFNFGRILEVMLRNRFPDGHFEVHNAAMTAINSHVVVPIARDCGRHGPDLFIVYLGNNEVVGPYGPGTIFAGFSPSLGTIRSSLWARSTRIGQLAAGAFGRAVGGEKTQKRWRGMEMFNECRVRADDPRLAGTYEHFRRNLLDICRVGRGAGANVVVCTVATNLKDCAPFASTHRADLSRAEKRQWDEVYNEGVALEAAGDRAAAVERYLSAAEIDDTFAELHFHLAGCLSHQGAPDRAREHLVRARDLDALRFRADTRINDIIREVGADRRTGGVYLVDAERAFEEDGRTRHAIPGPDLFHEHVHLTFEGNYLLARAVFDAVVRALPKPLRDRADETAAMPSRDRCAQVLALTGWDLYKQGGLMSKITRRAPFTNQLDHAHREERSHETFRALSAHLSPDALAEAKERYVEAIAARPDDWRLQINFAMLLERLKDAPGYERAVRRVVDGAPHSWAYYALGNALARGRRPAEAIDAFRRALRLRPYYPDAVNGLGSILSTQGRHDEAIEHYRTALRPSPDFSSVSINLASALTRDARYGEAIDVLRAQLSQSPDTPDVLHALVTILAKCPDPHWRDAPEAVRVAERTCQLTGYRRPKMMLHLAGAYAAAGRLDKAVETSERAAEVAASLGQAELAARIRRQLENRRAASPRGRGL